MPTIRQLLDRYGQPPQDLVLDWAWQIRQHADRGGLPADNCLVLTQAWPDLEVADDGQLLCERLDATGVGKALEDLSHWAERGGAVALQDPSPGSLAEIDDWPANEATSAIVATSTRRKSLNQGEWSTRRRVIGAFVALSLLLLLVVSATIWTDGFRGPQESITATSNSESTVETYASQSNSAPVEKASAPSFSRLDSLSLVEPDQRVAIDGSIPSTDAGALTQLDIDASLISNPLPSESTQTEPAQSALVSDAVATDSRPASNDTSSDNSSTPSELSSSSTSRESASNQPSAEAMRDVKQTLKRAEAEESVVTANHSRTGQHDRHDDPWILSRDTMRYRVTLSPDLKPKARESQWTLALEPIDGLVVEPQKPVTILPRGLAVWRIFEADAKPPRSCLFVRAVHHGRDGVLELAFCGGAEDMPGMSVPLAAKWIEPLTVRVQTQAFELRGALARLSTTVITPDQIPAVMQRKQAMIAQMFTTSRLGVIMPEINRLAQLVDGQVTMHAAIKTKPDEPALATWGQLP